MLKISIAYFIGGLSTVISFIISILALKFYETTQYANYLFSLLIITSVCGLFQIDLNAKLSRFISKSIPINKKYIFNVYIINSLLVCPVIFSLLVYFLYINDQKSIFILLLSPLLVINLVNKNYLSINQNIKTTYIIEITSKIPTLAFIFFAFVIQKIDGNEIPNAPFFLFAIQISIEFIFLSFVCMRSIRNEKIKIDFYEDFSFKNTIFNIFNNSFGALLNILINSIFKSSGSSVYIEFNFANQFFSGLKIFSNAFSSLYWKDILFSISNNKNKKENLFCYETYLFCASFGAIICVTLIEKILLLISGFEKYPNISIFITLFFMSWLVNELGKRQVAFLYGNELLSSKYYKLVFVKDLCTFLQICTFFKEITPTYSILFYIFFPVVFFRAVIYIYCSRHRIKVSAAEVGTFTIAIFCSLSVVL